MRLDVGTVLLWSGLLACVLVTATSRRRQFRIFDAAPADDDSGWMSPMEDNLCPHDCHILDLVMVCNHAGRLSMTEVARCLHAVRSISVVEFRSSQDICSCSLLDYVRMTSTLRVLTFTPLPCGKFLLDNCANILPDEDLLQSHTCAVVGLVMEQVDTGWRKATQRHMRWVWNKINNLSPPAARHRYREMVLNSLKGVYWSGNKLRAGNNDRLLPCMLFRNGHLGPLYGRGYGGWYPVQANGPQLALEEMEEIGTGWVPLKSFQNFEKDAVQVKMAKPNIPRGKALQPAMVTEQIQTSAEVSTQISTQVKPKTEAKTTEQTPERVPEDKEEEDEEEELPPPPPLLLPPPNEVIIEEPKKERPGLMSNKRLTLVLALVCVAVTITIIGILAQMCRRGPPFDRRDSNTESNKKGSLQEISKEEVQRRMSMPYSKWTAGDFELARQLDAEKDQGVKMAVPRDKQTEYEEKTQGLSSTSGSGSQPSGPNVSSSYTQVNVFDIASETSKVKRGVKFGNENEEETSDTLTLEEKEQRRVSIASRRGTMFIKEADAAKPAMKQAAPVKPAAAGIAENESPARDQSKAKADEVDKAVKENDIFDTALEHQAASGKGKEKAEEEMDGEKTKKQYEKSDDDKGKQKKSKKGAKEGDEDPHSSDKKKKKKKSGDKKEDKGGSDKKKKKDGKDGEKGEESGEKSGEGKADKEEGGGADVKKKKSKKKKGEGTGDEGKEKKHKRGKDDEKSEVKDTRDEKVKADEAQSEDKGKDKDDSVGSKKKKQKKGGLKSHDVGKKEGDEKKEKGGKKGVPEKGEDSDKKDESDSKKKKKQKKGKEGGEDKEEADKKDESGSKKKQKKKGDDKEKGVAKEVDTGDKKITRKQSRQGEQEGDKEKKGGKRKPSISKKKGKGRRKGRRTVRLNISQSASSVDDSPSTSPAPVIFRGSQKMSQPKAESEQMADSGSTSNSQSIIRVDPLLAPEGFRLWHPTRTPCVLPAGITTAYTRLSAHTPTSAMNLSSPEAGNRSPRRKHGKKSQRVSFKAGSHDFQQQDSDSSFIHARGETQEAAAFHRSHEVLPGCSHFKSEGGHISESYPKTVPGRHDAQTSMYSQAKRKGAPRICLGLHPSSSPGDDDSTDYEDKDSTLTNKTSHARSSYLTRWTQPVVVPRRRLKSPSPARRGNSRFTNLRPSPQTHGAGTNPPARSIRSKTPVPVAARRSMTGELGSGPSQVNNSLFKALPRSRPMVWKEACSTSEDGNTSTNNNLQEFSALPSLVTQWLQSPPPPPQDDEQVDLFNCLDFNENNGTSRGESDHEMIEEEIFCSGQSTSDLDHFVHKLCNKSPVLNMLPFHRTVFHVVKETNHLSGTIYIISHDRNLQAIWKTTKYIIFNVDSS